MSVAALRESSRRCGSSAIKSDANKRPSVRWDMASQESPTGSARKSSLGKGTGLSRRLSILVSTRGGETPGAQSRLGMPTKSKDSKPKSLTARSTARRRPAYSTITKPLPCPRTEHSPPHSEQGSALGPGRVRRGSDFGVERLTA